MELAAYYEYDIAGLLNLVDFCDDRAVRARRPSPDVLLVDLAKYCSTGGGATSGRAKGSHKYAGWGSSLANTLQILFGTWRLDPNAEAVLEDWRKDTVEARRTEFGNGVREAAEDRGEEFPDQTVHEALEKYDAEGHIERDRATWPPVTTPWTVADSPGAHSLATTTRYCIPDLLTVLARDPEQPWFGRSRVSIGFEEGRKVYGIGFTEDRDVVAWWSRAAFGAPPLIASSRRLAATWGVQEKAPFADIPGMFTKVPMPGPGVLLAPRTMSDAELEVGAALLSVESEGSCLTTANLALWREGNIALSSAQKFRFGQVGRQAHVWHASLDPYTAVFSTYPAARSTESDDDDGPNWWVGNASQPRVVQHEDALICIHDSVLFGYVHDAYGYRSHAWFPVPMFDEAYEVRPNDDGDTDVGLVLDLHTLSARRDHTLGINAERGGTWWFGRRGSAYVGVFSAKKGSRLMRTGRWAWREILCEDRVNVFVVQVGTAERFGTMEDFMRACCRARIHVGLGVYQPSNPFVDVQVQL